MLIGAGTTFIAGADIKAFELLKTPADSMARSEGTHALLKRVEDATKPLVAAIHGNALGGGLEVAQACHFRVATKDAKVGQPEVLLGHHPRRRRHAAAAAARRREDGARDVHRRQAGVRRRRRSPPASSITSSTGDSADRRDRVREGARRRRTRSARSATSSSAPDGVKAGLEACEAMRASLKKTARGMRAPFAVVDAIEAGLKLPFDQGSVRERELFADCVVSTESKALRHLFFAEREVAKVPDVPKDTPTREIKRAAVVGAGTMGGGIAMNYANAGIPVLLKEVDEAALERGLATIRKNYEVTMSKGKMTAEQVEKTMALITPTTSYDGFDQVDIVVEAVFENMDLKKSTFAELGKVTRPDCILASNSSTLDIDEFASASGRPAQVLGHHYFSPANVMKLLEIVRGRETSKEVIATSLKLAKKLGKVGVVVGNCFGFVANRMLAYYMREAYLLLEEGASVEQIDRVLTEFGLPVGPYGMQDIAGIDVGARIRQYLKSIGKSRAEGPQSAIPDRLFEMGRYGQKTGAGWYKYDAPGSRNRDDRSADRAARERGSEEARHHAPADLRRGDRRADHDGAGQRRRARARGEVRDAARRHRHHLRLRLRLPAPSRRPDVLRRHGRAADGAVARQRIPRAVRRLLGAGAAAREARRRRAGILQRRAVRAEG